MRRALCCSGFECLRSPWTFELADFFRLFAFLVLLLVNDLHSSDLVSALIYAKDACVEMICLIQC